METIHHYGLLLAHYAVRWWMAEAAAQAHLDPDRLSFTHAVQLARPLRPRLLAAGARGCGSHAATLAHRPAGAVFTAASSTPPLLSARAQAGFSLLSAQATLA